MYKANALALSHLDLHRVTVMLNDYVQLHKDVGDITQRHREDLVARVDEFLAAVEPDSAYLLIEVPNEKTDV